MCVSFILQSLYFREDCIAGLNSPETFSFYIVSFPQILFS